MLLDPQPYRLGVAILAAGASRRMGRPKLLLPWRETTIIGHLIELWRNFATQLAIVHAADDSAMAAELDRRQFPASDRIANAHPELGMFSSIQCAARSPAWRSDLTHRAIVLGDQPLIQPATLRALIDFSTQHPRAICQPSRDDRPRHPVILPADEWRALGSTDAATLRDFLHSRAANIRLLESNDDHGLDVDLDHPSDYERAIT
jgi:molybdenum cofactor cytidylyltransferase